MVEMSGTFAAARRWEEAGFSLIPVKVDGSKQPDTTWKRYQTERATSEDVQRWFGNGTAHGIGIVHGQVSGNSEFIDFDVPDWCDFYIARVTEAGYGEVIEKIVRIRTPTGGDHLGYRCESPVGGNQKLAQRLEDVPEGTDGRGRSMAGGSKSRR